MISRRLLGASGVLLCWVPLMLAGDAPDSKADGGVLKYTMKNIDGQDVNLSDYKGKVLMIVNVASRCGYTPQYKDLETLYRKYKDRGFKVLAFPANNFAGQEPGSNKEIKEFCQSKYDVTFDLFAKVSVKGDDICDLYKTLTDRKQVGKYGGKIRWNFQTIDGVLNNDLGLQVDSIIIGVEGACESPRIPVTATVTPSDSISISAVPPALCLGDSATLTISTANPNYNFAWSPVLQDTYLKAET